MSTITPTGLTADPGWIPSPLYRMTVEQYEAMIESGAFGPRDRFMLINGYLVDKMTQNPPHSVAVDNVVGELASVLPGWYVRPEKPLRIPAEVSVPEPDVAVVRGRRRDYAARHPGPADTALVVEVSNWTLAEDRKLTRVYTGGGIPVYWVINLIERQVEVYSDPGPDGYRSREDFTPGQHIPVVIDGRQVGQVAVDDILP